MKTDKSKTDKTLWYKKGLQGLKHYDNTGLHVIHEEVCAWLDSLKTDTPKQQPKCHK